MPKLITNRFAVHNAEKFTETFTDLQKGRNFFEYSTDLTHDGAATFDVGEQVVQRQATSATGFVDSANTTVVRLIDVSGSFNAASPVSTNATFTGASFSISVVSNTGIEIGDLITGDGIQTNTYANSIVGTTVTLTSPTASAQTNIELLFNNPIIGQTSLLSANASSIVPSAAITKDVAGEKNIYWFFTGKHTEFPSDVEPPQPTDAEQDSQNNPYFDMIVAKYIDPSDVSIMVPRHDWAANTVYVPYRDTAIDLYGSQFYVLVTETGGTFSVFKCLDNNNDSPSLFAPSLTETSPDDDFYFTNDGYQWKFMYSIPVATFNKFASDSFIPVVNHANASTNAVSGSIDVIEVTNSGSDYNSYTNGFIQEVSVGGNSQIYTIDGTVASSNTDFYKGCAFKIIAGPGAGQQRLITESIVAGSVKRVVLDSSFAVTVSTSSQYEITPAVALTGDGTGFLGRAIVNATANTIDKIEISQRGVGYTWANVAITGNTGFVGDLSANTARAVAVISPVGGHASDPALELGGRFVGISVNFDGTEDATRVLNVNEFRQIGIIKDALLANVEITNMTIQSIGQLFSVDQEVTQEGTGATGVVTFANSTFLRLTNVLGFFDQSANTTHNLIIGPTCANGANVQSVSTPTVYADQTLRLTLDNATGTFANDELITQGSNTAPDAFGFNFFANSSLIKMTNAKGIFAVSDDILGDLRTIEGSISGASAKVTGKLLPELVHNSGECLYIENTTPIQKANGQTETIKLILEF